MPLPFLTASPPVIAHAARFLASLALTLVALAVAGVLGEIVVRFLYKDQTVLFPRYHTDYQYGRYVLRGIRPNVRYWMTSVDGSWEVVTNGRGFRDARDFPYAKPSGVLRVLSLGDSHTQGYEVRQHFTFSAVLERALSSRGGKAEVLNAGVSGFSTAEALAFLENEGARYSPDVVVLGFYGNDFEDNLKAGLFSLDTERQLVEAKFEHLPGVRIQNLIYVIPPVRWLSENSYFYSLFFNNVWEYFKAKLRDSVTRDIGEPEYAVAKEGVVPDAQVALAAALVERMHRFCAQRGMRFIVVDIPRPGARFRYSSSLPPAFAERLRAARIEVIDSRELLAKVDGVAELHLPHGHRHISETTHTLIGIEIGRRLLGHGS